MSIIASILEINILEINIMQDGNPYLSNAIPASFAIKPSDFIEAKSEVLFES